jgi:hypothetical protein
MPTSRSLFLVVTAAAVLIPACGSEDPAGVPARTLEITVTTSGDEPDADGYTIQIDAESARPVPPSEILRHRDVSPGDHTVYVGGVADNCEVQGANPRTISVPPEGTTAITIEVVCTARTGRLLVTTLTRGPSPYPSSHTIAVDGVERTAIDTGRVLIGGIAPGRHEVQLRGVGAHCTAQGNPRTLTVKAVEVTLVTFFVNCVSARGFLEITTSMRGQRNSFDLTYRVDGGRLKRLGSSGTLVEVLNAGTHLVELLNVPEGCRVLGPNPRSVEVLAGGGVRLNFTIHCAPPASGSLQVSVNTTGAAIDSDGYELLVSGSIPYHLEPQDRLTISNITPGYHGVSLREVSENCRVDSEIEDFVFVPAEAAAEVHFTVTCTEPT